MRKIIGVTVAAVTAISITGCTSWGNPPPQKEPAGPSCAVPGKIPPGSDVSQELKPDGWKDRPGDIAEGHNWILVGVNVRAKDRALPGAASMEYCVPVSIKIQVDAVEDDANIQGAPGGRVYTFDAYTPWVNHFVPFDYDPTDPLFAGRPPRWLIAVEATYVNEPGFVAPELVTCEITIWGAPVKDGKSDPADGPARCFLINDRYDRFHEYS